MPYSVRHSTSFSAKYFPVWPLSSLSKFISSTQYCGQSIELANLMKSRMMCSIAPSRCQCAVTPKKDRTLGDVQPSTQMWILPGKLWKKCSGQREIKAAMMRDYSQQGTR